MLILFNKPHGVSSQFTDAQGGPALAQYIKEANVYAAGHLDRDTEGLLVLTDDSVLIRRLSTPRYRTSNRYLVQVEGVPTEQALEALRAGPMLADGATGSAQVELLGRAPGWLWPRDPPIRVRRNIPTHWLEVAVSEARNRQVRRMAAAVGLPCLRLVRIAVDKYELGDLQPGQMRIIG